MATYFRMPGVSADSDEAVLESWTGEQGAQGASGLPIASVETEKAVVDVEADADAIVHTDLDRDGVHWLFPAGGALMAFPFPDPHKWRLLDTTGDGEVEHPEQIARQFGIKLSQTLGRDTVVESPSWS